MLSGKAVNKTNKKTLDLFIGKLKEKEQNDQQLKQTFHAISLYYELGLFSSGKDDLFKDKNQNISIKKEGLESKDTKLLTSVDVKDYLTYLAVKRKISASSQNQAIKGQTIKEAKSPLDF